MSKYVKEPKRKVGAILILVCGFVSGWLGKLLKYYKCRYFVFSLHYKLRYKNFSIVLFLTNTVESLTNLIND